MATIDLSLIPPPDVVETLSFEDILQALKADLIASDSELAEGLAFESEPLTILCEAFAYRELLLRQRVNDAARQVMLASATGSNLDQLAALYGLERLVVTPGVPDATPPTEDVLEADSNFRRRIQLAPGVLSNAGPTQAYVFHAVSVDGVKDASATSPSATQVEVRVLAEGAGDGTADQTLLDAVIAVLNAENVRPLTDQVSVQSAVILTYSVEAILNLFEGPDISVVRGEAEASLKAFVNERHRLGVDVTESGIHAALSVGGVESVTLAGWSDIFSNATQAPWCRSISISTQGGVL